MQVFPAPDVSNSFFVTHDYDFAATVDRRAILAPGRATSTRPLLRVNQLSRSALPNRNAEASEDGDQFEVGATKGMLVRDEDASDPEVHQRTAGETDEQRREK